MPQKKSKNKKKYFDTDEEIAVKLFLSATTQEERTIIYNDRLKSSIDKMISSIIRRYKLYRKDMAFEEIHNDTHSFLITKIDKFNPSKGKKAYSYLGTICKNYLMGQIMKDHKHTSRYISYEDISSSLENDEKLTYNIDEEQSYSEKIINIFVDSLKTFMSEEKMNSNEEKLGYALIEIFENYENLFMDVDNKKFNKNMILLTIREMTNLSTKEIRSSMKRFKKIYKNSAETIFNI